MRVLSLFSGAGGLDLGFKRAGFTLTWAIDLYDDAVQTYRANIGDHVVNGDLSEVETSSIPHGDVVIGGFPCQGFSVANTERSPDDGRNKLYREFVRVVRKKKPRFFVAENVKGILSLGDGEVFEKIVEDFGSAGYHVVYCVLNAADYGVPQRRERVFIVGVERGRPCDMTAIAPRRTHAPPDEAAETELSPWITIGEALDDFPEPESDHDIPNHHDYSRYKLRFNGYLGHRRMDPDKPAPTVTGRGDMEGGVVVQHHPGNNRRMSPREVATVQGFPTDYIFKGSLTSTYRQIANAVPPPLAQAVASALKECADRPGSLGCEHGARVRAENSSQLAFM